MVANPSENPCMPDARSLEAALVQRCAEVAKGKGGAAVTAQEAQVLELAAALLHDQPLEAQQCLLAAAAGFAQSPGFQRVHTATLVREGLVPHLPRFKQLLRQQLSRAPATKVVHA